MQYPLISEYVRAIQDASNNLDELAHLVPVQDDHGEPYRCLLYTSPSPRDS